MNKYEAPSGCIAVESIGWESDCQICCLKPKEGETCDRINCCDSEREDKCTVYFIESDTEDPLILFIKTFDILLLNHPFLFFSIDYCMRTDWTVRVWDADHVVKEDAVEIINVQATSRNEAMDSAYRKLQYWARNTNENH
jgi:hypothetical protein